MTKKVLTSALVISFALIACKKEKTSWNSDWAAPIAYGHLTINDMVPVENTEVNADNYLSLVIHRPVFEFSLDTLIKLPDTTVVEKTAINVPSLEVTPSFIQPTEYNQVIDAGDIELKEVIIKSGTIDTRLTSSWPGKTKVALVIPKAIGPEGTFGYVYFLDAGSIASPTEDTYTFDMKDYRMEMDGVDGTDINTIGISVVVQSNEETDSYVITDIDTNTIGFTFIDMIPKYARGYFGQYSFSDTMSVSLAPMKRILGGTIDIDSIDLKLTVKNGFNLVGQAEISKITGYNTRTMGVVDLDFPAKGVTMNIDPADGGYYDYVPSEYPIDIDNTNSNFTEFIENLSDSVEVGYRMDINPFGNITAGNDEFFPDSKMELFLDAEFPLAFAANDLTVADTLDIDWIDTDRIVPEDATVILEYENGFPIGADAKFYLLDGNNVVIDSIIGTAPVLPGTYMPETFLTTPYNGIVSFDLSNTKIANLELTKRMVLHVSFNTDGDEIVKFAPDTFFDFKMRSNLEISVSL